MSSFKSKLHSVCPSDYNSIADMFDDFYQKNKTHSFFSYRYLANKLSWPVSLFNEIAAGKRKLTVARAVQFAKFLNLTPLETESLIFLSLKGKLAEKDQEEFSEVFIESRSNELSIKDNKTFIYNHRTLLIMSMICWMSGKTSPEHIHELMYMYDWSLAEIEESFADLTRRSYIKLIAPGEYEYTKDEIVLDEPSIIDGKMAFRGLELHKQSALGFIEFCENPKGMSCYNTGTVVLSKKDFREVALKLVALRNWICERSDDRNPDYAHTSDSVIFQFDLNMIPLVDISKNLDSSSQVEKS